MMTMRLALFLFALFADPVKAFSTVALGVDRPFSLMSHKPLKGIRVLSTVLFVSQSQSRSQSQSDGGSRLSIPTDAKQDSSSDVFDRFDSAEIFHPPTPKSFFNVFIESYWGPRLLLVVISCFYASNFPLGAIMSDAFPSPSAVTSARMALAALTLSPFLLKIDSDLRVPAIMTGAFTAFGYVVQSMSLGMGTSPATVSFLGTATVLVCPLLEWIVDRKPMSLRDAPQTWLAATLCISGVGLLEMWDPTNSVSSSQSIGVGDMLALLQAVGFGTQVFLSEKLLRDRPGQALPFTATLVATTALLSAIWTLSDGWMWSTPNWRDYTLPGLLFEPSLHTAATAIIWTGVVSTAMNFVIEMTAISRINSPAEASVILATEPLWAALFASILLEGESLGIQDYAGGFLLVSSCLVNACLSPEDFAMFFGKSQDDIMAPSPSLNLENVEDLNRETLVAESSFQILKK